MLRIVLWRLTGLLAFLAGLALIAWFIDGGPGKLLRGHANAGAFHLTALVIAVSREAEGIWGWTPALGLAPARLIPLVSVALATPVTVARINARRRRRYVRLRVEVYRADHADIEAAVAMFGAFHKRLLRRWWQRLLRGQPSLSLEVHHTRGSPPSAWLAVSAPRGTNAWSKLRCRPPIRTVG